MSQENQNKWEYTGITDREWRNKQGKKKKGESEEGKQRKREKKARERIKTWNNKEIRQ